VCFFAVVPVDDMQYAKNTEGVMVDPKIAQAEANAVFRANPISASMSGLMSVYLFDFGLDQ
jgi:hypothetical protein